MRWFSFFGGAVSPAERERRKEQRAFGIQRFLFVAGLIFLFFIAFMGLTLALKPMIELKNEKSILAGKKQTLEKTIQERERLKNICTALEQDAAFNEMMARDRGLAAPHEVIIEFPDEEPTQQEPTTPEWD